MPLMTPCGIDHGTTNSAMAVMDEDGLRVVKPDGVNDTMPSVVFLDKRRRMLVGNLARRAMVDLSSADGDGHVGYKRRLGQDDRFEFSAARKVMTAPELGGIVMGELLKAYRNETDEAVQSCVITIPAQFEQSAQEGTREAARLAGLRHYPLLQEPIAAALAYGFSAEEDRANWMIFDLGGGTLDVSIVAVRKGEMVVPGEGHIGDKQLGGRNFDRTLMDFVLGPRKDDPHCAERFARYQNLIPDYSPLRKQYRLESFTEQKSPAAWKRLWLAIEEAKIELSRREESVVEVDRFLCRDDGGTDVRVEFPITRKAYDQLISTEVERAIHLCHVLLSKNRLTARDISRLVLIGGPTKTPVIQQMLSERLGIELETSIDPMTAVAQGAALYAATVEPPEDIRAAFAGPASSSGDVSLRLEYEPTSRQPSCIVMGVVECESASAGGVSVEIKRKDGGWDSGRIPVDEDGVFEIDVQLSDRGRPYRSEFQTSVLDAAGKVVHEQENPSIWYPPPAIDEMPLAHSLRVALAGNNTELLVRAGDSLPARGSARVSTVRKVESGSDRDVLSIPVVESVPDLLGRESERADCSVHVGTILISGDQIDQDIPKGTTIDLTVSVSKEREIEMTAYLPLIDHDFDAKFTGEPYGVTLEQIENRYEDEKRRLTKVRQLQSESPPAVDETLEVIDKLKCLDGIEEALTRARDNESDALHQSLKRVLELSGAIDHCWKLQAKVRLNAQANQLSKVVDERQSKTLEELQDEIRQVEPDEAGSARISNLEDELNEIDRSVRQAPYFQLILYVGATIGKCSDRKQRDIHNRAFELTENLIAKGAPETLTDANLRDVDRLNREFLQAFTDLDEKVETFLKNIPPDKRAVYGQHNSGVTN